jgi:hypothetical protein
VDQTEDKVLRSLGEGMVQLADRSLITVCKYVVGDQRLARVNLIAFCAFGLRWTVADRLSDAHLDLFTDGVYASAATASREASSAATLALMRSRCNGFLDALEQGRRGNAIDLGYYFQACCSVDRIEIPYSDIYPNPDDMERGLSKIGPLTESAKEMISRVRAMPSPATYPMAGYNMHMLSMTLLNVLETIKNMFSKEGFKNIRF